MAYVPTHIADVFVSYCHDDDFVWIDRFVQDLKSALTRKLRARTRPEIFFDAQSLRAGREFDYEIPACLAQTGFFVAIVSRPFNASTYCRHEELSRFLRHHKPDSGRLLQLQIDVAAPLPVTTALAVTFADVGGPFVPDSQPYRDALRRVYEPIVTELDRLYAESKLVFLAWPGDPKLRDERSRLHAELEGRGLRIFPEAVAEYEDDIRLRDALHQCTTSVHFFGQEPDAFDLRQWEMATRLSRPCVLASRSSTEARRGPADSPDPIYLDQGNPTVKIATAVERIAGIGRRDERAAQDALGLTPIYLLYQGDSDATLGMRTRKRIKSRGPFDVIVPPSDPDVRYEELGRAKAAVLCGAKAEPDWVHREVEALHRAMDKSQLFDLPCAFLLPPSFDTAGLEVLEDEAIFHSENDLDDFLHQLRGVAA